MDRDGIPDYSKCAWCGRPPRQRPQLRPLRRRRLHRLLPGPLRRPAQGRVV